MSYVIKNKETGYYFRTTLKMGLSSDVDDSDREHLRGSRLARAEETGDESFGFFSQARRYKTESSAKRAMGGLKRYYEHLEIIKVLGKKKYREQIDSITVESLMNFGKYKGKPIKEVPEEYLVWLYNQPNLKNKYFTLYKILDRLYGKTKL